jgi:hypothetical protein
MVDPVCCSLMHSAARFGGRFLNTKDVNCVRVPSLSYLMVILSYMNANGSYVREALNSL